MSKILDVMTIANELRRNAIVWDEGFSAVSAQDWTNTVGSSATVAANAQTGGLTTALNVPTGNIIFTTNTAANSNASRFTTLKSYFPALNMPLSWECRFLCAQQNTNQVNLFLGFSSTFAAGLMQNSSAGPNTNFTGAGLYLAGGGTTWGIIVSNGTTQTSYLLGPTVTKDKTTVAIADGAWHRVEVRINPTSSTYAEVLFLVDGILKYSIPEWTFTSGAQMGAGAYINAGSTATNAEILNVDYQWAQQQRIAA